MKKETKELISWLKEHLSHYRIELATGRVKIGMVAGEKEEERAFAAIDFLNTLPEIESHLCRGGYIQDRNGTPCCEGDIIRIIVPEGNAMIGRLCWSDTNKNFSIRNAQKRQIAYFVHNLVFEKVEK